MNKQTVNSYFLGSQHTRVALRQATCPEGFCLIVEDEENVVKYLRKILTVSDIDSKAVDTINDALFFLDKHAVSIICCIIDLNIETKNDGLKLVDILEEKYRKIPYVVYTAEKNMEFKLKKQYPHINVVIKGRNNTQILLNALGII